MDLHFFFFFFFFFLIYNSLNNSLKLLIVMLALLTNQIKFFYIRLKNEFISIMFFSHIKLQDITNIYHITQIVKMRDQVGNSIFFSA